jgi:hypothetical protein
MFKFNLGRKVRENICGLVGVVMARSEYLTGCRQYGVLPMALDKDGKIPAWEWLDESRLEDYKEIPGFPDSEKTGKIGGPSQLPPEM